MSGRVGVKVLIELDNWHICEYENDSDAGKHLLAPSGLWVWHQDCPDVPENEEGVNQESWMPADSTDVCIVCNVDVPDEIMALVILYTGMV